MDHLTELSFLTNVLRKRHTEVRVLDCATPADMLFPFRAETDDRRASGITVEDYLGKIEMFTKYRMKDGLSLQYIYFLLSEEPRRLLFIGPYLDAPVSEEAISALCARDKIPQDKNSYLSEYYAALPVIPESDGLHAIIDTFCETVWQRSSFDIVQYEKNEKQSAPSALPDTNRIHEIITDIERLEKRYAFENELIEAVTLGQQHKAALLSVSFTREMFEKRHPDSLRNAKNYCIIMNTLFRKAAENGGVHPLHIDRLSSDIAAKIEKTASLHGISALMKEIFSSYARLVYQHAIKKFSPIVQKAVLIIDTDLSADLTLSAIAARLGISAGYLATVFKKEQGRTVTGYVLEKRMKRAAHLLRTANLEIQAVAALCGILDVQYFSKLFKKTHGKTPGEYRRGISR